jgi:uncharacterized protein (TIGR02246 family)
MSDQDAIKATLDTAVAAVNAGDRAGWAACLGDDVVFIPPNGPAIVGKDAVRAWAEPFFDDFDVDESASMVEVEVAADWAFCRYGYSVRATPKAGGEPTAEEGQCLAVFRRHADGTWKMARHAWGNELAGA